MTADPATLSAISDVLKNDYLPGIREQFSHKRTLENLLETNTEDVKGLQAVMAIRTAGNPGIGFRGDNEDLPDAGRQQFKQVLVPMRYLYGRCQFTGPAIAASRDQAGAFAKIMEDEMSNLTKDFRTLCNVFNFLDGSGALAQVASVTDTNNIVVDRWSRLFSVNRVLDSYTAKSGGSQNMNSKAISAVSKSTLTLTINGHGASAGDFIFLEDTRGKAQMGLLGIFDDGSFVPTLQSLSRTDNPIWKAKVMGNSGNNRTISEALLTDAISLLEEDDQEPDFILGTIFQRNDLVKELTAQRQFVSTDGKTMKLKGGIRAVEICDLPFVWDRDAIAGYTFIGNTKKLSFYRHADIDWMQKDGGILSRIANRDAYEATLYLYRELGVENCGACLRLDDIAENRPSGF